MRAGKGVAAAPEVSISRREIKSMMFSINIISIILLIIILYSVRAEPVETVAVSRTLATAFITLKNFIMQPILCDLCLCMFYKNRGVHTDIISLNTVS